MSLEMIWSCNDLIMKSWLSWESAWRMSDTILRCLFYYPFKSSHEVSQKERKRVFGGHRNKWCDDFWMIMSVCLLFQGKHTLLYLYGRQSISGSPSSSSSLHECPFIGIFKKETLKKFGRRRRRRKKMITKLNYFIPDHWKLVIEINENQRDCPFLFHLLFAWKQKQLLHELQQEIPSGLSHDIRKGKKRERSILKRKG